MNNSKSTALEVEGAKGLSKREDVRLLTIYKQYWRQWSVFGLLLTINGHVLVSQGCTDVVALFQSEVCFDGTKVQGE